MKFVSKAPSGQGKAGSFRTPEMDEQNQREALLGKKTQTATPARILVVDDEEAVRESMCSMLMDGGYDPYCVAGGNEALALLEAGEKFEILVCDLLNYPMDGLTLLETAKAKFPRIPVFIASAVNDPLVTEICMKVGAYEYLVHPVTREELLDTVRAALAEQFDP